MIIEHSGYMRKTVQTRFHHHLLQIIPFIVKPAQPQDIFYQNLQVCCHVCSLDEYEEEEKQYWHAEMCLIGFVAKLCTSKAFQVVYFEWVLSVSEQF